MSLPITPACVAYREEVFDKFPNVVDLGYYNRRYIAGTTRWSDHAWGAAVDWGGPTQLLDLIAAWTDANRTRLKVRYMLWRSANHWDHIHVSLRPKPSGVPPYPSQGDDMEAIKGIQRSLNAAGFTDVNGTPLTVDGQWGPRTEHAYQSMCVAASQSIIPNTLTITSGHLEVQ